MREKYESLALADLKAIAKARGLRGTSSMKKAGLIELMLAEDEKDKEKQEEKAPQSRPVSSSPRRTSSPKADGKEERSARSERAGSERMESRTDKAVRSDRTEQRSYKAERTGTEQVENRTDRTETRAERTDRSMQTEGRPERAGAEYKADRPEGRVEEGRSEDERFPAELDRAGLQLMAFLRLCRMATASFAAKIICPGIMTCMWLPARSGDLD